MLIKLDRAKQFVMPKLIFRSKEKLVKIEGLLDKQKGGLRLLS